MTLRLVMAVVVVVVSALGTGHSALGGGGDPAVDSAAVARGAWREMGRAERAGDLAGAWVAVRRAVAAWPEQPTYLEGLAVLAARRGDTTALLGALERLGIFEVAGFSVRDSAVARMASGPAVGRGLARLRGAVAARPVSRSWATLADTTLYAEGLDADSATGTVFVASVRHRTIYQVTRGGEARDLGLARWPRVGAILGVRVDPVRRVIWATTAGLPAMAGYQAADSSIAALLKVRIIDGTIEARYDLADGAGHVLGDLAIGPAGDVFVTDSRSPIVYRLAPGAEALTTFVHPLFRSLQGAAPTSDGTAVYLADYSHGLLRWNLATGAVTRLSAPPGTTSLGVDGIVLDGARIFAIQNGVAPARLVRFDLEPSGERIAAVAIVDRHLPLADEPTIATRLGSDLLYVANSQWEKYDDRGRRLPGTTLAPTAVLSLRIR